MPASATDSAMVEDPLGLLRLARDVGVERQRPVDLDDMDRDQLDVAALGMARAATSLTIRASLEPPFRAITTRVNGGSLGLGHGRNDTTAGLSGSWASAPRGCAARSVAPSRPRADTAR